MINLIIKNLDTGYGKKQVLYNVNLNIEAGETILLIGSNGSGKSTLLKTIYGLLYPWNSDSQIICDGDSIKNLRQPQLMKKGILYKPQQNELFEDLSVKENLEISCIQTIKSDKRKEMINEMLLLIPSLNKLKNHKCNKLSGGERKQLSMAMMMINKPKLLLLDEPLAGLSPNNFNEIISIIQKMKDNGVTIIIVEHRIKALFDLVDKVIGLKLGKIYPKQIKSLKSVKEVLL